MAHSQPLLSRVADAVYWMARYIERAENVARFLEVNHNLVIDLPFDYTGAQAKELGPYFDLDDPQLAAGLHFPGDFAEIVFRNREDDRDRLELGDGDERGRAVGGDDISRINPLIFIQVKDIRKGAF